MHCLDTPRGAEALSNARGGAEAVSDARGGASDSPRGADARVRQQPADVKQEPARPQPAGVGVGRGGKCKGGGRGPTV